MKKVVMIISQNDFRDEELLKPKEILEKNGIAVVIASSWLNQSTGMLGAKVKPDILLADIKIAEFAAIVFIGGSGASQYWDDPLAHKLAQDAAAGGKIVAAICIAPVTLAKAGVLQGKRATVWSTDAGQIKIKGALYSSKNVEIDGNIITAGGPFAAREFGEELAKALKD